MLEKYVLLFQGDKLISLTDTSWFHPLAEITTLTHGLEHMALGNFEGKEVIAFLLPQEAFFPLSRQIAIKEKMQVGLGDPFFQLVARAKQLLHWNEISRYSGCCGVKTVLSTIETAKICPQCQKIFYPQFFPVVIFLIRKGKEILLARSFHFPKEVYSAPAGFVDPGESCESAIHREAFEEVGLKVDNLVYFGSQCWPFPGSLMIGYFADYVSGDIQIDGKEIEDARWCDATNLPTLPPESTIARHMIDHHFGSESKRSL